ncbi:hypothetical protein BDW72DRAFT_44610 [Aspergillus terricola var. indicus]
MRAYTETFVSAAPFTCLSQGTALRTSHSYDWGTHTQSAGNSSPLKRIGGTRHTTGPGDGLSGWTAGNTLQNVFVADVGSCLINQRRRAYHSAACCSTDQTFYIPGPRIVWIKTLNLVICMWLRPQITWII